MEMDQLVKRLCASVKTRFWSPEPVWKLAVEAHTCNPSAGEAEVGEPLEFTG